MKRIVRHCSDLRVVLPVAERGEQFVLLCSGRIPCVSFRRASVSRPVARRLRQGRRVYVWLKPYARGHAPAANSLLNAGWFIGERPNDKAQLQSEAE